MDSILLWFQDFGPFVFGLAGWFITGIDDLVIFSGIYNSAKTRKQKTESIQGLLSMVLIMLVIVCTIGWVFGFLHKWTWVGGFLPLALAIKTWFGIGDNTEPKKGTFYWQAFTGFGLNCLDDIAYNTAVITGKAIEYQTSYLLGIFVGAIAMVCLAHFALKGLRDMPRLRAAIMFCVSLYILYPGMQMLWLAI